MKGVIYPRPGHPKDATYYYDSEKTGVINSPEGDYSYKGVVTAVRNFDSRDFFYSVLTALENKPKTHLLAAAWGQICYRAETRNPTAFKATAYCSIEDNFDLQTGMRVARYKCNDKINAAYDKYTQNIAVACFAAGYMFSNTY